MRYLAVLILLSIQGCLQGCFMNPTDAKKLLGFSNPTVLMEVDVKEAAERGKPGAYKWRAKIPTDFVGKADVKTDPTTGELNMVIEANSTASTVVAAEGQRITDQVLAAIQSDHARAVAQSKILADGIANGVGQVLAALPAILPLLQKPPKPEPVIPPIPFPLPQPLEPVP